MSTSHKKPGLLRRFFGGLWSLITWLRVALLNVIFIVIVLVIIFSWSSTNQPVLPQDFALRLAPTGLLVDQRSYIDPASMLLSDVNPEESETVVRDLVEAINYAAQDDRVTSLVLELDYLLAGGLSKLQEVGQALNNFKASGKEIIAFGDNFTQDQYYLASFADEIYLNDMGAILLTGYGSYRNYYKGALDKLDINFHVFRAGKFKDAVEPLLREDMSEESKEHNALWLNHLWDQYVQQVETLRELEPGTINDYINNADVKLRETQGSSALLAMKLGLVDGLLNQQQVQSLLLTRIGKSDKGNFYRGVDYNYYLANIQRVQLPQENQIGLLVASGMVLDGDHPDGTIGSHTIANILQQVREEKAIQALVLRIDSGGGSAFASEMIRTEIEATREAGIPVFVSMGSLAASGGYWMAAGADQIWATPTTLTGSIGVFGAFPTFEKTLANMGLNTDGVGTTEMAGSLRIDRALSPKAQEVIQIGVEHIYQRFVELVADARGAAVEDIDKIAQGHVWSGISAKELGLVDHLGTLEDTLAAAAEHVGITDYSVTKISRPLSAKEILLRQLAGSNVGVFAPNRLLQSYAPLELQQRLAPLLKPLSALSKMNDPQSIYAACLDCIAP